MIDKLDFGVESCFEQFVYNYMTFSELKKFMRSVFLVHPVQNGTHENFRALKVSNICQQMFQNNSEHCNSACQSFNLTTFLRSRETFTHQK